MSQSITKVTENNANVTQNETKVTENCIKMMQSNTKLTQNNKNNVEFSNDFAT